MDRSINTTGKNWYQLRVHNNYNATMLKKRAGIFFVVFSALALLLGGWRHKNTPFMADQKFISTPWQAISIMTSQPMALKEIARYDIPMLADTPAAHASFLLSDKGGGLRAFWFAGSRESGEDVQIVMSQFVNQAWTSPIAVVNRHTAASELGAGGWIRRLGNPVAWIDTQGRTHLYVVATGLGGWAASRVLHLVQTKHDEAFKPIGFLSISPFFNLSTLVRGTPVPLQDGGILLPAYFELGIKYPIAIRLNSNGELVQSRDAVVRMAGNLASLQPTVVVTSPRNATAYLRDNSGDKKLRFVQTTDGGKSWQSVLSSQGDANEAGADWVINPDSSLVAQRVGNQTLLIHNPQTSGRHRLVIEVSDNGLRSFKRLATLEYEPEKLDDVEFNEYSYPSVVVVGDKLHVSYTYQKRFIRHVVLQIESTEVEK
jgi:predicted neuraminidase